MPLENHDTKNISESPNNLKLREALQETLEKAAQAQIELYLTGGTAAAVYAGEKRPMSLDLDFFVAPGQKEKIRNTFGGDFEYFGKKALFKSDKLVTHAGNGVDLDFIAEQNIVPDENKPDEKITLRLNEFAKSQSCTHDFMDIPVPVLPPELIVIAKLFAGRGKELGKYDLEDARAIIESGITRPRLFERAIIEMGVEKQSLAPLVLERLKTSLQKLTEGGRSSEKIVAMMAVVEKLEQNPFAVEQNTATVHKPIIEGARDSVREIHPEVLEK